MAKKDKQIDLETLQMVKDMMTHKHYGEVTPVHLSQKDHDSFADFTSGLRQNWVFVIALFSVGFWLISNTFETQNINQQQDNRIESNAAAIVNINKSFEGFQVDTRAAFQNVGDTNNEIIRRLDALQKDIEVIKTKE